MHRNGELILMMQLLISKAAWITNYVHFKLWDEITNPFPNCNGCTVEVWEWISINHHMMTSSNGNIFHVTGPLCGDFTGYRWIPLTKASDAELWCFLLICVWINGWINIREAGYLRRHGAHNDVIVMGLKWYNYCSSYMMRTRQWLR